VRCEMEMVRRRDGALLGGDATETAGKDPGISPEKSVPMMKPPLALMTGSKR
jgi:hypothetical protein